MIHELKIEKAVAGGKCMARHEGKVIFVPYVIPGEVCSVRITADHGQYSTGVVESLIERSPDRVEPACPAFGICGGCSYMHMNYRTELEMKRQVLHDALRRTGGIQPEDMPEIDVESGPRFGYRSHCTFKIRDRVPGFFREKSNDLVPVPEGGCRLLPDELNRYILSHTWTQREVRAAITGGDGIIDSLTPRATVTEHELGITYRHRITGFFQANRHLRSRMLRIATELCGGAHGKSLFDIGCGCGFFSLHMARQGYRVFGYDIDRSSIEMAEVNRKINAIEGVTFHSLPASRINPARVSADVVLVDPPRAGLDRKTRGTIRAISPDRIVYVSCNPVTFARDCMDFTSDGYSLRRSLLLDMFPCTSHMEVISLLVKD